MHLQGVMQLWVLLVMVLVCSPVVALQGRPLATHRSRLANAARPLTMMSTSPSSFDHAKTTTLTTKSSLLWKSYVQRLGTVAVTSLLLSWSPSSSLAVSGGGKDFGKYTNNPHLQSSFMYSLHVC